LSRERTIVSESGSNHEKSSPTTPEKRGHGDQGGGGDKAGGERYEIRQHFSIKRGGIDELSNRGKEEKMKKKAKELGNLASTKKEGRCIGEIRRKTYR